MYGVQQPRVANDSDGSTRAWLFSVARATIVQERSAQRRLAGHPVRCRRTTSVTLARCGTRATYWDRCPATIVANSRRT
jgi:hypothetical protein